MIGQRISHAEFLPAASQPPHDPKRYPLNSQVGWHIATASNIVTDACAGLTLAFKPETARLLTEANGSLGGIILPKNIAYSTECGVLLLDRANALLKKFDPCECEFLSIPCTGGKGVGVRQFNNPGAIAICGDNCLVADSDNHRIVVYSLLGFMVRGFWSPPAAATEYKWKPVDLAISQDRKLLVADPANGCVHVFNFAGRWLRCISGLGAVETIAVDVNNHLYVVAGEGVPVTVYDLASDEVISLLNNPADLTAVQYYFCSSGIETSATGLINLGHLCALYQQGRTDNVQARWFNVNGLEVSAPVLPVKKYQQYGVLFSEAIDSRFYRCQWDRLSLYLDVPVGSRVKVSTFTAESELTSRQIELLADNQWRTSQWLFPDTETSSDRTFTEKYSAKDSTFTWDGLILSDLGRYLWLKIEMTSDGQATPGICAMQLDYPRISLRRYLPAVFGEEANSADFTDRFLAVFDRGFRQIESQVDTIARLFDPLSAPAKAGKSDFLSWLASWIGVTLDRQLPLSTRRSLVKNSGKLFQCRGTVKGLRQMLDLYLNFSSRSCASKKLCGPCSTKADYLWKSPHAILEHYKLRRWLFLGAGRLGEQARLWGKKIVNRSQLGGNLIDGNAQLGVTELNTRQDPLRDPFHVYAHKFTIFLPGWVGRLPHYRKSISHLIAAEKPAHTQHNIFYVEPRFRVGIQSMIGFDSVIACYPQGITLGESQLGKASVLSESELTDSTMRIGSKSTIGSTLRIK